MKKPRPNRIAQQRKLRKISQQELADAMQVHWTTVSKLERGITHLTFDVAEEVAEILKVDVLDVLPEIVPIVRISISGYINHGGDVEEIEADKKEIITISSNAFYDTETIWFMVRKNALYPYFRDGDILGITWANDDERRDLSGEIDYSGFYGRFCLVEDMEHRHFLGIVSQSGSTNLVDLHNANYPPLRNIEPFALGQVTVSLMLTPAMRRETGTPEASD